MAIINGESVQAQGLTISDYLARAGYDPVRVVVEQNLQIIPKSDFDKAIIQESDIIEILAFVGGG